MLEGKWLVAFKILAGCYRYTLPRPRVAKESFRRSGARHQEIGDIEKGEVQIGDAGSDGDETGTLQRKTTVSVSVREGNESPIPGAIL